MGCVKVSQGCKNCYAETLTKNRMGLSLWGPGSARQRTSKQNWAKPVKWNREAPVTGHNLVFCASLADIFEDNDQLISWRKDLFDLIEQTPNLEWQVLTKRPDNINRLMDRPMPENVWIGTSIENMDVAHRADHLRKVEAKVRFISYEPALGPLNDLNIDGIHWIIYGGESGPGYRPEDKQWARDMKAKCEANNTAFFHKQSASYRTEMGIHLDGEIVRHFPIAVPV